MRKLITLTALVWIGALGWVWPAGTTPAAAVVAVGAHGDDRLNAQLAAVLAAKGFTGTVQASLEDRLGRRINPKLADLGRLLWFDNAHSLHQDNTCAGCHSPTNGFGDTQCIAIGVQNNNEVVGPRRAGARNQRRTPLVVNTAFLPALMWNGRFNAPSRRSVRQFEGLRVPGA